VAYTTPIEIDSITFDRKNIHKTHDTDEIKDGINLVNPYVSFRLPLAIQPNKIDRAR
jgi:hypothetical protein